MKTLGVLTGALLVLLVGDAYRQGHRDGMDRGALNLTWFYELGRRA